MEAARREVGENISLAHLLIPTCLHSTPIPTPALRGEDTLKPPALMNRRIVHSLRVASRIKSIVDPFSCNRDMRRILTGDKA